MKDLHEYPDAHRLLIIAEDLAADTYRHQQRMYGGTGIFSDLPMSQRRVKCERAARLIQEGSPHQTLDAHRELIAQTSRERMTALLALEPTPPRAQCPTDAALLGATVVEFKR